MAKKKTRKKLRKKSRKKVVKKTFQKSRPKAVQKKKTTRMKTLKKVKKVKAPKKLKALKKLKRVKAPKKVKTLKRLEAPKKARAPKKIKVPKKRTTQQTETRVLRVKKSEEERRVALRNALIKKREEIVREAKSEISKYIKGETRQLVDTALDNGDWSIIDLSEDISLKQLSTHRETLLRIDEALRKLGEGTYGKCEDCGEDISEERLKVLPFAIYCRDCQEKKELLEKIGKEEKTME
jgi:DnaK suppressor protein